MQAMFLIACAGGAFWRIGWKITVSTRQNFSLLLLLAVKQWDAINTSCLGLRGVSFGNKVWIRLAVFARCSRVTDRLTD